MATTTAAVGNTAERRNKTGASPHARFCRNNCSHLYICVHIYVYMYLETYIYMHYIHIYVKDGFDIQCCHAKIK